MFSIETAGRASLIETSPPRSMQASGRWETRKTEPRMLSICENRFPLRENSPVNALRSLLRVIIRCHCYALGIHCPVFRLTA